MENGRSGAPKSDRLGLSCSDAVIGDLGVLTTHETSQWFSFGDVGSTRPQGKTTSGHPVDTAYEEGLLTRLYRRGA